MPTFYLGGPGSTIRWRAGSPRATRSCSASRCFLGATHRRLRARAARMGARAPRGDDAHERARSSALDRFPRRARRRARALRPPPHWPASRAERDAVRLRPRERQHRNGERRARAGDLTAAAQGNLFAPGARIRLQTPAGGIPYHTAYDSDVRSSPELNAAADDRWFEPSRLPTTSGTLLCTDLNRWFAQRPPGIPLKRWHTGNRVEPLVDGLETFARLWDDLRAAPRARDRRAPSRARRHAARSG